MAIPEFAACRHWNDIDTCKLGAAEQQETAVSELLRAGRMLSLEMHYNHPGEWHEWPFRSPKIEASLHKHGPWVTRTSIFLVGPAIILNDFFLAKVHFRENLYVGSRSWIKRTRICRANF